MNNKTMFYGLLIAGGVLAYYAWMKNSLTASKNAQKGRTSLMSATSGVFVDDVPVDLSLFGLKASEDNSPFQNVKEAVSQIVEPLFGTQKQGELTGEGSFADA
jgi:hypothetical protein